MNQPYAPASQAPVFQLSESSRAAFLNKTYMHLFGAIILFTGIEIAFFRSGVAERMAGAMLGTNWLFVLGGFMVVAWLASRVAHTAQSLPAQYTALIGFVIAEAIIFVPLLWMATTFEGSIIRNAAIVTITGFLGLTAIVFVTGKDFSFLRGILFFAGVLALIAIVCGVLFGFELGLWFSIAMVGLAGGAILYDTSNILHHYPEDRYVGASLELFASVALMFWYVLRIFMSRD